MSTGFQLYSPNEVEDLSLACALQNLESLEHRSMLDLNHEVDKASGLKSSPVSAVGDWADGAENSVLNVIQEAPDFEAIRYSAAIKGDLTHQKCVTAFLVDEAGPDSIFRVFVPGTFENVRESLNKHQIQFRTLIPRDTGVEAVVFDQGARLRVNIEAFANEHDIEVEEIRGHGEFIGGDTREAGQRAYRNVIDNYEEKSHQRRYAQLSGYWTATLENRRWTDSETKALK